MKLNLPSTLTSQKISSLFLLILTNYSPAESGSRFTDCLANGNSTYYDNGSYNALVEFANDKAADRQNFCCSYGSSKCVPMTPDCSLDGSGTRWVQCNKIGQSEFCVTYGHSGLSGTGGACGGIAGNISATNSTIGDCPSLDVVDSALNQALTPSFSWLCCSNGNCNVPVNVVINDNSNVSNATICTANQHSLMCFADNGGWSCTGDLGSLIKI